VDGGGCSSLTIAGVGPVIGVGIVTRFIVAGAAAALGLWLIYVGMTNIGTRTLEETVFAVA
jgi:hypothetical protein